MFSVLKVRICNSCPPTQKHQFLIPHAYKNALIWKKKKRFLQVQLSNYSRLFMHHMFLFGGRILKSGADEC